MNTIYLDAVWLLNFFLDWMILLLTQSITRDNSRKVRVMTGAIVASTLVPITLFLPDSIFTTPIGKGLYSLIIIFTAFGWKNFRQFLQKLLSFYFVSFVLGGGLIALHFMLGQQITTSNSGILTFQTGYGDQLSWGFVCVGFPIIWIFTKIRMDKHALEKFRHDQIYEVTIELKGQSFKTTGYVDSGNQLIDPFTRKPVIICDQLFMSNWFSNEELKLFEDAQQNLSFEDLPSNWSNLVHIVPYQGVDGNRTFMMVLKPDKVQLNYDNKEITTQKVFVGVQFGELATDGKFHCLLNPRLFNQSVATSA